MEENKITRTDTKVKASKGTKVRRSSDKSKFCATKKGFESQRLRETSFPIIGIGASAGGLEAFTQLLKHLPLNTGMAFVLVQHLSSEHESMLSDILSRSTKIPINEVQDGMQVKPDHVYVIPANMNMTVLNRVLNLRPRVSELHMPIDTFFISLAEDQNNKAIGVLLSGTGTDGTKGMKAIKNEGGITFAQNQESAKYYSMPHSAIAADCVDFVLAPEEIARELVRISRHPYVTHPKSKILLGEGDDLQKIFAMLKSSSSVDFTHYKHTTIKRRITRRMVIHKLERTRDYVKYLRDSPKELEALFHDILISVTCFFRKPETFQILKGKLFPIIVKNKSPESTIRIWVPGCSTGEEVYSIAISLREFLDNMATDIHVQIFGTDVDEEGIAKARSGIYPESIAANVSQERLKRFFDRVDRSYRVNTIIREMCIFARQDMTKDPPFSDLDLISCRNVLIYFGPVLQRRVIPIFHYALNPTGFLMLGLSESISSFSNLFTPVDKKYKVFSKKPGSVKVTFSFADLDLYEKKVVAQKITTEDPLISLQKEADRIVLTKYAPAGVIINDAMEILFIRGHTGPYLEPASGEASLSLMRMAREDLQFELRTAIHKARKENGPVREKGLRVRYNGQFRDVNFEVTPIKIPQCKEPRFLVLFEDVTPLAMREPKETAPSKAKPGERLKRAKDRQIAILKEEIASTKKSLQVIIEEQEATNEELKVAMEEVQSSNEELQSMNEELETSKEELQSTNEELTTVNDELSNRNLQLKRSEEMITEARIYAENIVETVWEPLVILDAHLRVVSANRSFYRSFQITPEETEKRLVYELGNRMWDIPKLRELLEEIVPKNTTFEGFGVDHVFATIGRRAMLLNARRIDRGGDRPHLILLTIEDITEFKKAQEKAREAAAKEAAAKEAATGMKRLETYIESMIDGFVVIDLNMNIVQGNKAYANMHGYNSMKRIVGKNVTVFVSKTEVPKIYSAMKECLKKGFLRDFETVGVTRQGRKFPLLIGATVLKDAEGEPTSIIAILKDITEMKKAQADILKAKAYSESLITSMADGLWVIDFNGKSVDANPAVVKIMGYKNKAELLKKNPIDVTAKRDQPKTFEMVKKSLLGKPCPGELNLIKKDGKEFPALLTASGIKDAQGKIIGAFAVIRDITERKKMEGKLKESREKYLKLFNFSPIGTALIDLNGQYLEVNKAYAKIFGVSEKTILGRQAIKLTEEKESKKTQEDINELLAKGFTEGKRKIRIFDRDLTLSYVNTLLYDKEKKPIAIISMIQDITERKRLQEELIIFEKLAAVGQLASTVGHEIRNPLGVIKNSSYFLNMKLKDTTDEKIMKHLNILEREVNSANLIVSDLLDFARKKPPSLKQTDLNDVIMDTLTHIPVPQNTKVTTKLDKVPSMLLDPEQIRRVLQNIILNAVQAMPDGGKLAIQTVKQDNSVKITFTDTGIGIPEENLPKLFTPLFSTKAKGVGLGLTICKQIVEDHDGNITIRSKEGKGSTFTIKLPIRMKAEVSEGPTITVGLPVERKAKSE